MLLFCRPYHAPGSGNIDNEVRLRQKNLNQLHVSYQIDRTTSEIVKTREYVAYLIYSLMCTTATEITTC